MKLSVINRLIQLFSEAFSAMGAEVPMADSERLAMRVHCGMEYGQRVYHTSPHVLDICRGMKPRQVLAGLFHDIVYYQLDGGFPRHADAALRRVVLESPDGLSLRRIARDDFSTRLCMGVFGFAEGDKLPLYGGMNEFLSAIVAVELLQAYLPRPDLLAIVACIEATVPFRGKQPDGQGAPEQLASRLRSVAATLDIPASPAEIDEMVCDAVLLANRDVMGFAVDDPALFLSATWSLIEESNAPLAMVGVYSVQEYRQALQRMAGFLASLDPVNIFHTYQGVPDAAECARLLALARHNLDFSVDYLGAKLSSMAVIEALALVSGGDAPVSMLIGDIVALDGRPMRIEDHLIMPSAAADCDLMMLEVLERGRRHSSSNDLNASPLTAYLYRHLGAAGMKGLMQSAEAMFAGRRAPLDFLRSLPSEPLLAIIDGAAAIAVSRAEVLRGLRSHLAAQA